VLLFAATIGVGACLLFQVQFILGKQILPWFGGAPAVWTTCMLFFQLLLLAGYAYAHLLGRVADPRRQRTIHLAALAFAAALLLIRLLLWPSPITPADTWKPGPGDSPVPAILGLLLFTIGPPFLVLASTGPLLQSWYARCFPGASPYRLYALSNLGSLLGLLSYPFVLEPLLPLAGQGWAWSAGFLVFVLGCGAAAVQVAREPPTGRTSPSGHVPKDSPAPTRTARLLWFCLAMVASVLLLAITSQISLEVAVIPFLWMLPLTLYLLSFVLCFEYERLYHRGFWIPALLLGAGATAVIIRVGVEAPMLLQLAVYLLTLFFACMVCHGELVRRRPDPRHLTGFYLTVSAGGAAGGIFTGILAPALFLGLWELPLALLAACALAVGCARDWPRKLHARRLANTLALPYLLALAAVLGYQAHDELDDHVVVSRGFFGVLRVDTDTSGSGELRHRLRHGRITHGLQFADPDLSRQPTTYYGPGSAIGLAIHYHQRRLRGEPLRLGFVGLGTGTLASYAARGDSVRFYEIDPDMLALSSGPAPIFTYLRDCAGSVEVALGDARVNLEREQGQGFDVLAIDAFSSDSIPVHLLTVEAVQLYLRHLRGPDSILAIHISNRYLDLDPVVRAIAERLGLKTIRIDDPENNEMVYMSDWMLMVRDPIALSAPEILATPGQPPPDDDKPWPLWTDAYSNLMQVFKG